jgi:two-component system LytT family response regulator
MSDACITALIVDDEPLGRDLIRHLLAAHRDFRVVGECSDGDKALVAIQQHAPQLVFLDIKMPRLDGMTMLQQLESEHRPHIVFVTAHDNFAIQAFEASAFDYLLKPFDQERFDQTLSRLRHRMQQIAAARLGQDLRHLLAVSAPTGNESFANVADRGRERIVVRESGRVYFVDVSSIEWVEASGNYVALHVADGKTHLVHETMAAMEVRLDSRRFVRIHRSTIVRLDRIKELLPHFNGEYVVVLKDNVRLKLSRGYLDHARSVLGLG